MSKFRVSAQDNYPSRPVKVIVALPAGGSVDMVARLINQQLTAVVPVTKLVNMVLVARDKARFGTPANLLAAAKANPGKLTYASSGDGSPQHLAGLLFESQTGVKLLHIPYKGGASAITDLIGGVVDMAFAPVPEALAHIKSGNLHQVGVLADKRAVSAPDIPTLREGGVNNVVLSAWIGLRAPAKTPQPIRD